MYYRIFMKKIVLISVYAFTDWIILHIRNMYIYYDFRYEYDTDKEMKVLKFTDVNGKDSGMIEWVFQITLWRVY